MWRGVILGVVLTVCVVFMVCAVIVWAAATVNIPEGMDLRRG